MSRGALLDRDALARAAERVIDASRADETEVTVESELDRFCRFAEVGPTQSGDRARTHLAVRVRFASPDGVREARAECVGLDEESALAALRRAEALAQASRPDAALLPLEGPVRVPATAADVPTLTHPFGAKADWVGRAVNACDAVGLRASGLIQTSGLARCIVNSRGRSVYGERSRGSFALTASPALVDDTQAGSGMGYGLVARIDELDVDAAIARAVRKADTSRKLERVEPGEHTVVLEPAAVSAPLLFATYQGFGAREVGEESSFLCGRLGQPAFASSLTIRDDVLRPSLPGIPFDGEGSPTQTVTLVENGRPIGPVTDRVWAGKLGLPCTGHARPQPCVDGPGPEHLVVEPGESSLDELIAGVEHGLLVTQFHYTNVIEPRELLLTGMTRNGTFRIEHGEVAGAVRNLRFTESLVRALRRVSGVGRECEASGALFEGDVVTPALRIEGFRFTSTSDF